MRCPGSTCFGTAGPRSSVLHLPTRGAIPASLSKRGWRQRLRLVPRQHRPAESGCRRCDWPPTRPPMQTTRRLIRDAHPTPNLRQRLPRVYPMCMLPSRHSSLRLAVRCRSRYVIITRIRAERNSRMNICSRKARCLVIPCSVTNTSDTKPGSHTGLPRRSGERQLRLIDTWVKSEVDVHHTIRTWLLHPPDGDYNDAGLFDCSGLWADLGSSLSVPRCPRELRDADIIKHLTVR